MPNLNPTDEFHPVYRQTVPILLRGILMVCVLLALAGCSDSFQPFQENDVYYFSFYGYLDASADTQWVRVEPARTQLETPPVLPEISVSLENLQSGDATLMNDSLIVMSDSFNVINYWTTVSLEYGRSYRLTAEDAEGRSSRVTVTLPDALPTPRVRKETSPVAPTTYSVFVDDSVEHLVDVQSRWYVRVTAPGYEQRRMFYFSHRNEAEWIPAYGGVYSIFLQPAEELERIRNQSETLLPSDSEIEILHRQVYVASGGPEWNEDIPTLDDLVYALPGSFSNVENGLGYVVGIDSKIVPLRSCFDDEAVLVPCPEEDPYW